MELRKPYLPLPEGRGDSGDKARLGEGPPCRFSSWLCCVSSSWHPVLVVLREHHKESTKHILWMGKNNFAPPKKHWFCVFFL